MIERIAKGFGLALLAGGVSLMVPTIEGGKTIEGSRRRAGFNPSIEDAYAGAGLKIARGDYSFAADGGAVGTIGLIPAAADRPTIPSGAIVLGGFVEVDTALTGATATAALQIEAANDLVAAAAVSGAPWSTTGRKSVIPVFTGASALKTTAARNISLVIGTAALTAGAFKVIVFYVETAAN